MRKHKRDIDTERLIEICEHLNKEKMIADLGLEAVDIAFYYIQKCGRQADQINLLVDKLSGIKSPHQTRKNNDDIRIIKDMCNM